jgi:hypothetical protein
VSDFDWIGDLGRGSFATVIKVRHRRTGEVFALKEAIHLTLDAYEEAEVLVRAAASPSPYVVRCHAAIIGPDAHRLRQRQRGLLGVDDHGHHLLLQPRAVRARRARRALLGVDKEVVLLNVEVRDAVGVQIEEAHKTPRSHLGQRRLGEPAAPSAPAEDDFRNTSSMQQPNP